MAITTTITEAGDAGALTASERLPTLKSPYGSADKGYRTPLSILSGLPYADVASATTCDIGAAASEKVRITGTTTITGLGTATAGVMRSVRFAGILTLTHNATSLILPGAASIVTTANDMAEFVSLGSGNWICTHYQISQPEILRSLQNERAMIEFVTDARGGATRRAAIRAGSSPGNDQAAVAEAVAWAYADPTRRSLFVEGDFVCSTDIPNFFDVRLRGPGSVKLGTGAKWYVEPNHLNTGFSPLGRNTIYLSKGVAGSSDSNSGLSPLFPVLTLQAALDRFKSFRTGYFRIWILDGVYRETSTFNQIVSSRASQFEILGASPASVWNNTTPPTEPMTISAITSANPVVITAAGHGRSVGEKVMVFDAVAAASAEHASVAQVFTITAVSGNDITVNANGTGWPAYVGSGYLIDMNGSSPPVVFFGYKNTGQFAISQDANDYVTYYNLMFVNWGTRSANQNAGGIWCQSWGSATLDNVHAYQCGNRVMIRSHCIGDTSAGGYVYKCGYGDWSIAGRSSFGGEANPGSASLTTTGLYHKCVYAVSLWEGSGAHFDGAIVKDCDNIAYVYGAGAHLVSYYMNFINTTGSALNGFVILGGGNVSRSNGLTDVITGEFKPILDRRDGTVTYQSETRNTWQSVDTTQNTSVTPAGGEIVILTTPIPKYSIHAFPQGFRAELWGTGTWANDTVIIRVKLDSTVIYSRTEALNATGREMKWLFEAHTNGFNVVRLKYEGEELIGSTLTSRFDLSSPAFDTTTGNQTLTVTAQITHASDTLAVTYSTLDKFGC